MSPKALTRSPAISRVLRVEYLPVHPKTPPAMCNQPETPTQQEEPTPSKAQPQATRLQAKVWPARKLVAMPQPQLQPPPRLLKPITTGLPNLNPSSILMPLEAQWTIIDQVVFQVASTPILFHPMEALVWAINMGLQWPTWQEQQGQLHLHLLLAFQEQAQVWSQADPISLVQATPSKPRDDDDQIIHLSNCHKYY